MTTQIEILSPDDVISSHNAWLMPNKTYTTDEFCEKARQQLNLYGSNCDRDWVIRQDACRVLQVGGNQGWRSGKMIVRINMVVEFEPEEEVHETKELRSEASTEVSPLDLLRE